MSPVFQKDDPTTSVPPPKHSSQSLTLHEYSIIDILCFYKQKHSTFVASMINRTCISISASKKTFTFFFKFLISLRISHVSDQGIFISFRPSLKTLPVCDLMNCYKSRLSSCTSNPPFYHHLFLFPFFIESRHSSLLFLYHVILPSLHFFASAFSLRGNSRGTGCSSSSAYHWGQNYKVLCLREKGGSSLRFSFQLRHFQPSFLRCDERKTCICHTCMYRWVFGDMWNCW